MVVLIEVDNEVLEEMNKLKIPYNLKKENLDNFIYVPSINLYVAKQRTYLGENWPECHKLLQLNNERMLIVPEFNEFLEYAKINFPEIYNEITEIREPWRAEYLDASFEFKDKKLYINSAHVLNSNSPKGISSGVNLIPKNSKLLDSNTLMQDKEPGISLENLLESSTNQGFPNKNVKSGSLYYRYPRSNNNSVVRFNVDNHRAYLLCDRNPSNRFSYVGVRAVKSGDSACIK